MAALALVISIGSGVVATWLLDYEVADGRTLWAMVDAHWTDDAIDSRNQIAALNVTTIVTMRAHISRKATALAFGLAQGGGVLFGAAALIAAGVGVLKG